MAKMGRPPVLPIIRFMRQALITDSGCVEWSGYRNPDGYGQFRPGGRDTTKALAHRWAYEHFVGPIPEGLVIDHLCKNRACVNVTHLEPVTARENWLRGDGPARINRDKTHCLRGHPLSGDNLAVSKHGGRSCVTCHKALGAANYQKRRLRNGHQ